jgi:hypothetical protein
LPRETSKALQENGATVVISDINPERGEKVAQELGLEFFSVVKRTMKLLTIKRKETAS